MIRYVKGDLCAAPEPLIIHGCNMQGVMGAGVARAIRAKWPIVYTTYRAWYESQFREFKLGVVQTILVDDGKYVANLLSQRYCGSDGRKYASYIAIVEGLTYIAKQNWSRIAMPKIGCGLGGLNWTVVEALVDEVFAGIDVAIYEL